MAQDEYLSFPPSLALPPIFQPFVDGMLLADPSWMMTHRALVRLGVIGLGVWLTTPVPSASACQFPGCSPDYFLPYEGSVPANVARIQWRPGRSYGGVVTPATDLTFRCTSAAGNTRDVLFRVEGDGDVRAIVPDETLIVGDSCQITVANSDCDASGWGAGTPAPDYLLSSATFSVVNDARVPTSLGELHATSATVQSIEIEFSHGCSSKAVEACGVPMEIELSADAAPWRDALVFETFVDGEVWNIRGRAQFLNEPGGSLLGRGKDLIYAQTVDSQDGTDLGIAPGVHRVMMRATLPGTDVMLETAPIEITLDCAQAPVDTGCSVMSLGASRPSSWLWSVLVIALLAARRKLESRVCMSNMKTRAGVVALGLWLNVPIHTASACSAPICWPEVFWPGGNETLPVNATALWWTPGSIDPSNAADALMLTCTNAAGATREIALHVQGDSAPLSLVVDDAFAVGDTCEIAALCDNPYDDLDGGPQDVSGYGPFKITEAAPLPTQLAVDASPSSWRVQPSRVYDSSGDCFAAGTVVCRSDVAAVLDGATWQPWSDGVRIEARVDGGAWFQLGTPDKFNFFLVSAEQRHSVDVAPGSHSVALRASLASGHVVESETITLTIEECSEPAPVADGGGLDASADDPGSRPTDGCTCSVVSGGSRSLLAWPWSLAVLALLAVWRLRAHQVRKECEHA